jgi:hypothetical protein
VHLIKEKIPLLFFMMELFLSPLIKGGRGVVRKRKSLEGEDETTRWVLAFFALLFSKFT